MIKIGFDAKRIFHNKSGLGNYSRDLVRMLSEYFPENKYLLFNPKRGKINFEIPVNAEVIFPKDFLSKKLSSIWRRQWIIKDLKKNEIDLFHGLSNELPSGISKTNIPSIVSIHDLIFLRNPEFYKKADVIIQHKKVREAAKEANHIVAMSEYTKNDIINYLGIAPEKISVIYQGCHSAFKKKYSEKQMNDVVEKFQLPEKFILNVGTIERRKNLMVVLKSMKYHNYPLVVVGKKTDYFDELNEFIQKEKLGSRVQFPSGVSMEELSIIYQKAFALIYPSIIEGFGIPIIEALFSGTPVITNKEGCFPEAGGPNSLYIDIRDEKMIAQKISDLENEDFYLKTVENGLTYARRFEDREIANQMMNLYKTVINSNH